MNIAIKHYFRLIKKVFFLIILFVIDLHPNFINGQVSGAIEASSPLEIEPELKPEIEVLYNIRIHTLDYTNRTFLEHYLEYYDKNYSNYKSNEFELNKQIDAKKQNLGWILSNFKLQTVYTGTRSVSFGEYDFNKNEFSFNPFPSTWDAPAGIINNENQFFLSAGFDNISYHSSRIIVSNINDFTRLQLSEVEAQKLLNEKTVNGNVNRKLSIKFYYSIMNGFSTTNKGLYCYVYKMEVWTEKCVGGRLVKVIDASTAPPEYLTKTKQQLFFANTNNPLSNYICDPILSSSQILITTIGTVSNPNNCNRAVLRVVLEINKMEDELYQLNFTFCTNGNLKFFTGYSYTFVDLSGQEYPLIVNGISDGIGSFYSDGINKCFTLPGVTLNITKPTLTMLASRGLNKIRFQMNDVYGQTYGSGISLENMIDVGSSNGLAYDINQNDRESFKKLVDSVIQ